MRYRQSSVKYKRCVAIRVAVRIHWLQTDEGKFTDMHISTMELTAPRRPAGGRNHNIFAARTTTAVTTKAIECELLPVKWISVVLVLLS